MTAKSIVVFESFVIVGSFDSDCTLWQGFGTP
jgi:hypothetical protein